MSGAGAAAKEDDFIGFRLATGAFAGDENELNFCDGLASRDEKAFGFGRPDRRGPGIALGRLAGLASSAALLVAGAAGCSKDAGGAGAGAAVTETETGAAF